MDLVEKKEIVAATLDLNDEIFIIHVASLVSSDVHSSYQTQIAFLKANEAPTAVSTKYADIVNIFSPNLIAEFWEYIEINNHVIDIINGKQTLYRLIYSLELMELKILKIYIKINLANNFIKP